MKKIDISIIVPIFNVASYLPTLLDSLINQTLTSIEIIAINYGSTDYSLEIIQEYAKKDSRIVIINQFNHGVSIARNNGLKYAQGRYIAFADSDDWLAPDALKTWFSLAEDASLDMVIGYGFYLSNQPNDASILHPILSQQASGVIESGSEWITRSVKVQEWPHFVWLQLIRKDYLEYIKARFTEHIVHEDIIWTLQVAISAKRIGFVKTPFYGYRRNNLSITTKPSENAVYHRANSYIRVISELVKTAQNQANNPTLKKVFLKQANIEGGHFLG
jgi:glycosyltransferase involved in cell wall biosynthesis